MEIERFQIRVLLPPVGIVLQLLRGGTFTIIHRPIQRQFQAREEASVVIDVSFLDLLPRAVHQVPRLISSIVEIVGPLFHGMFVETVEARLVHQIDRSLIHVVQHKR